MTCNEMSQSSKACGCSTETCGCCEGTQALTPAVRSNRPGLDALSYRVGTHGAFLETMKARIASMTVDAVASDGQSLMTFRPLQKLNTRATSDPSIALLDGWAVVADVLSFYQERIANEAYLRTATERRSVLELARLVGYALRPGVSASVYLAYTLDDNQIAPVEIAPGARSQSIPGPDELPQSFETSEALLARAEWSNLLARRTQPQRIDASTVQTLDTVYFAGTDTGLKANDPLLFSGFAQPVLRYVDSVEADFENKRSKVALRVATAAAASASASAATAATAAMVAGKPSTGEGSISLSAIGTLRQLVKPLSIPPALPAARSSAALTRNLREAFGAESDVQAQVLGVFHPEIKTTMYSAWANGAQVEAADLQVYGFGVRTGMFGGTAPLKPAGLQENGVMTYEEWPIADEVSLTVSLVNMTAGTPTAHSQFIVTGKWEGHTITSSTIDVGSGTSSTKINDYCTAHWKPNAGGGVDFAFAFADGSSRAISLVHPSGQATVYAVTSAGLDVTANQATGQHAATDTHGNSLSVNFQSQTSITITTALETSRVIALDAAFDQILPDSLVVVQREGMADEVVHVDGVQTFARADYGVTGKSTQLNLSSPWRDSTGDSTLAVMRGATVLAQSKALTLAEEPVTGDVGGNSIELDRLYDGIKSGRWIIVSGERADIAGVMASELVMIAGVKQAYDASLPGDKVHTTLQLANALAYQYKRETLKLYGNVVKATHGETRLETLGSGNGAQALQSFSLKQPPLTHVSASTPSGVASTLKAYVNEIEWHEQDTLAGLGPRDRAFVTKTGNDDVTQLIFGNGEQGARLPTGVENVRAVYRNGIGRPGNVLAGQISLLQTRPLGVKEVINPLRASGGADRESLDLARENTPLAVMALDRLVSLQDYADFARTFAGIGKAAARRLSDGRREFVQVTIAGADDIPIDLNSDLYLNLCAALRKFGDPSLPVGVDVRELIVMVLSAKVRLAPDYVWDPVAARIRARLLEVFGFGKRALAQPVALGQIIATIQNVEGVDYVDVDTFGGLPENVSAADGSRQLPSQDAIRQWLADSGQMLHPYKLNEQPVIVAKRVPPPAPWVDARPADVVDGVVRPAQLAIFVPTVPDTLILNQIG